MNFELSDDQKSFVDLAKQFGEKELAPVAAKCDSENFFPVDVLKKAGGLGFCGLYSSTEWGGLGLPRLDASLIFEQLSAHDTAVTAYLTIHNMATWMVTRFGKEKALQDYAQQLTSGEALASYCLTEPDAGSDAAALKTKADKQGEDYILNGSKAFISGAGETDILVVMARTGEPGAKGVSCFMVPADSSGISFGKNEEKMGWKAQPTRTIIFEDVKIPSAYMLGNPGEGFKIAMQGLDGGRINIASCSLGTAQAALDHSVAYMKERKQFGKTLSEFQTLQFKLAEMAMNLVASQQMVRLAASKLDQKDVDKTAFCAMAKKFATDACFDICNQALQLHGGYGYLSEFPVERYVRDSRVHQILEGTNEIMQMIIARRLISEGPFKN